MKSEALPAIVYSDVDKSNLNHALGACLATQRTYGKQAGDFDKVVSVFIKVLNNYEPQKVITAIKEWILKSPEFPTPADIMGILNPQPKFDYAVYTSLCNRLKAGDRLDFTEKNYIKAYEQNAMKGL